MSEGSLSGAGVRVSDEPDTGRRRAVKAILPVGLGLSACALALTLQRGGVLGGWPMLIGAFVLALAVPSSRELSRRFLYLGCITLGAAPLLWWFAIPDLGVTRIGLVTSVLFGALLGWAGSGRSRRRLRRIVPRVRPVDLVWAGGTAFAAWVFSPLFRVPDGETALVTMLQGWDYAAHFNMVEMIRRSGLVLARAPGGPWFFADYPQGFHAAAASVMEATVGASPAGAAAEVVGFARATVVVSVIAVATVVAGVVSLPSLRRRPFLAIPLVALVVFALTCGPGGGTLLVHGFPNFVVATSLLACIPLVVIPLVRVDALGPQLALACGVVGIAHNWFLLLIAAGTGLVAALLPLRIRRWPSSPRAWVRTVLVGTAALLGVTSAADTLLGNGTGTSLFLTPGGFVGGSKFEIALPIALGVTACAVALGMARRAQTRGDRESLLRAGILGVMPLAGAGVALAIGAYQIAAAGELTYYFWKTATAIQLMAVVLLAAVLATGAGVAGPRIGSRVRAVGIATILAVALPTASGVLQVSSAGVASRTPPGLQARWTWSEQSPERRTGAAQVLRAADVVTGTAPHFLVPDAPLNSTWPRLLNQWFFALTGGWSRDSHAVVKDIWGDATPVASRPDTPREAVRRILELSPRAVVVVSPGTLADLSDGVTGLEPAQIRAW